MRQTREPQQSNKKRRGPPAKIVHAAEPRPGGETGKRRALALLRAFRLLVGSTPTLGTNPNRSTTCVIEQSELTILCAAKPLYAEYLQNPRLIGVEKSRSSLTFLPKSATIIFKRERTVQ